MNATPSTPIVWFQLVDAQGNNFRQSSAAFIFLPPPRIVAHPCDAVDQEGRPLKRTAATSAQCSLDVVDFCDAVKAEYADSHLKGIAPSNLVVYANKAALTANETPLEPDAPLDGMGADHASALVVVVPSDLTDSLDGIKSAIAITSEVRFQRLRELLPGIPLTDSVRLLLTNHKDFASRFEHCFEWSKETARAIVREAKCHIETSAKIEYSFGKFIYTSSNLGTIAYGKVNLSAA
jgi:hypothetical protein